MTVVLCAWACWILLQAGLLLAVPWTHAKAMGPVTNGFVIVVPDAVADRLTVQQIDALIAHERGHIECGHAAANFLLRCVFVARWPALVWKQETEADDVAIRQVDPMVLCEAIRATSFNDLDWKRAKRLERIACARRAAFL